MYSHDMNSSTTARLGGFILPRMSDASSPLQPKFKSAEEAAEYDRWFRTEVEAAIRAADSPDATFIPHREAMAHIRTRLLKMGAARSDKPQ